MLKKVIRLSMFFIFCGALLAIAQSADWEGLPVRKIKFIGLKTGSSSELQNIVPIRIGSPVSAKQINKSIKTLFGLSRFSYVEADVTKSSKGDGVIVTFTVKENIYLKTIIFEGNRKVYKEDLVDLITLTEKSYFSKTAIEASINNIMKKYHEEGFIDAKVKYKLIRIGDKKDRRGRKKKKSAWDNDYELVFTITEGKKVVVEKIVIEGANEIQPRDIKGAMKTKSRVFIFQSGVLKKQDFAEDKKRIIALYGQKGYINAKLTKYEWKIEMLPNRRGDEKHKALVVYITIEEGEQYFVGDITIKGNTIFETEKLRKLIALKKGDVYDKIKMELARFNIYNKYSDNGHLYANVSMLTHQAVTNKSIENIETNFVITTNGAIIITNIETKTITTTITESNRLVIDTEFKIYEGPRAHIESVSISGNDKTLTKVIKRELIFDPGELYIQRKVRQSYERLMQLQYFKNVNFVPTPGSAEGLIGLDIAVEEQRTGLITFGVGYGTESGINATAQISEKNLAGTGRTLTFKGEYGQTRQLLEVSFQEPWLFDSPTYAGFSVSYANYLYDNVPTDDNGDGIIDGTNLNYITNPTETIGNYTSTNKYYKESISLGFNVSRRFSIYWNIHSSISGSFYQFHSPTFKTPLVFSSTWQTNTSLLDSFAKGYTTKYSFAIGLGRNSTDNAMNPTGGSTFNLDFYYNGGIFGGNIHYLRPKLSMNYYFRPLWKFVIAMHFSTEFILPQFDLGQGNTFTYDTTDMLWFDGVYEMRGWQYYPSRGLSKAFASTELRFPIYSQELWGLLFYDIGNLWTDYDDMSFQASGYLMSFGIGIKINIPMLPIRLYLARKVFYDSGLSQWQYSGKQEFFDDWRVVFSIQGLF